MSFDISGKVALISGGASGIGLRYAKELLRNGLRGVMLADINDKFGNQALKEIENEFGPKRASYIRTDVTNKQVYEEAFKKTIQVFKNLDILINNAGIIDDTIWEKEIAINLNGVANGTILGLEHYIPKYKSGKEGVIVNISSIAGLVESSLFPIYSATKFAIVGMSKSFGTLDHYERTKVKVLTLCPGLTETALLNELSNKSLGEPYKKLVLEQIGGFSRQKPESVALAMVAIIKMGKPGSVWITEGGKDPFEFSLSAEDVFAPKPKSVCTCRS